MSFVSVVRDYVEVLNNITDSFTNGIPINEFITETIFYFLRTGQYLFIWVFTFQWLRDFTLLPIIVPQTLGSILKETFVLENPSNIFFSFLEMPSLYKNSFLLGFFNSLFLTLPFSIIHILTLRRLFIKGAPAAIFSISGYLVGQWVFIGSVIFGLRFLLIPWLTLEPLNYILGIFLIFRIVYSMTQENLRELSGWQQPEYINFFVTSFLLSWCEQTSIFQYLGNISAGATTSILESVYSPNLITNLFGHSSYILGIIFGSIVFTLFWGFFFLQFKNICIRYTPLFLSSFIQTVNTGTFVLAVALSLSSIPFYGLDYLTTGPLGFVSQDRVFKNSLFDQHNIKDSVLGLGISSQFDSIDVDISPFDRGRYLLFPERTMPFDFEDVNYRGEAEWTTRYDKVSTVTDSRAGFLSLAKLFKKQKIEETQSTRRSQDEKILPLISKFNSESINIDNFPGLESKYSRFEDWYSNDSNQSTEEARPLESIFNELQDTSFPLDFLRTTSVERENIDFKIKEKYYSNPIYKNLLTLDIDLFLNRQPANLKLKGSDETDLYEKRRMLTSYYDSLRDYSKLSHSVDFENYFDGSKSFTNKIYNQQFKGTLRSLCRLFYLTIDNESNKNSDSVELSVNFPKKVQQKSSQKTILKFDQPLYRFSKDKNFFSYHEELNKIEDIKYISPFLEDQSSAPLYGGWDEKLRRFVITNKFLPRTLSGYGINVSSDSHQKFKELNKSPELFKKVQQRSKRQTLKFTVWPLKGEVLNTSKNESFIPFSTLYTSQTDFEVPGDPRFDTLSTLPSNWETRNRRSNIGLGKTYGNIFDYLAPQRGGFIWPGNSKPTFKISS